ncbi:MAG: hypothetical protein K6T83_15735 [Alicyclobacillus sp.]|nr:hypothetical protein [Alicyclobacillus sp.]
MKGEIERQLRKIIGMPMILIGRASNMLWTSFGTPKVVTDRRGNQKQVGDYAIHVQCSWRIANQSRILVASNDIYVPSSSWVGEYDDFDWDVNGNNLFDERIQELFIRNSIQPVVTKVQVDQYGGFKLIFTDDLVLEAFPNSSNDLENWRMFVPYDKSKHFVVSNQGIGT